MNFGISNNLSQVKRDVCEWIHVRKHRKSLPSKIAAMRAKDKIKVLFVLWDLPMWKTEPLYRVMLEHPRFEPVLGLTLNIEDTPIVSIDKYNTLRSYIRQKGYEYLDLTFSVMNNVNADLIFYEKPYDDAIDNRLWYKCFTNKLICHSNYAFNSNNMKWCYSLPLHNYSSFYFVENSGIKKLAASMLPSKAKNFRITGLPFEDELLLPKESFIDQWKSSANGKKRIIWAPHYTIVDGIGCFCYSCFLNVCELMIDLAEKYKEYVQFAFKPHPLLKSNLTAIWGIERTLEYYERWRSMCNSQIEEGQYMGLFKYSDAMIHDCSSFTIEYLYTHNPVLYLVNGRPHMELLNDFAKEAYNCHYFGSTQENIEQFIQNVINNVDPKKAQRQKYFNENLLPPNGKTACENIIDAILGQNRYE